MIPLNANAFSEIDYLKSRLPIEDHVLEEQCKRRGVRMTFLTLQLANRNNLGTSALESAKELYRVLTEPMVDSKGQSHGVDGSLFLRLIFWSTQADQDVTLFNEQELAHLEADAIELLGTSHPMDQERYETFKMVIKGEDEEKPTNSSYLVN